MIRTVVQILSLVAFGASPVWLKNPSNWLDIIYIVVVFFWSIVMNKDGGIKIPPDNFRTGTAISAVFLWTKLLAYLRNTYIDFAVFLGGLFYVVRRLVAFLVCLCIILIAFSQMFFTVYRKNEACLKYVEIDPEEMDLEHFGNLACDVDNEFNYCSRWTAFLNTLTMLVGKSFHAFGSCIV